MVPMRSSALEPTAIGLSGDTALDFHWIWFFPGSKHVSRFRVPFCQDYLPLNFDTYQLNGLQCSFCFSATLSEMSPMKGMKRLAPGSAA